MKRVGPELKKPEMKVPQGSTTSTRTSTTGGCCR